MSPVAPGTITWWVAGVSRDFFAVVDVYNMKEVCRVDIGLDVLGNLEGVTDALSDRGWEQTKPWHESAIKPGIWNCDVIPIPENDNSRRADLALALSQEDEREGVSRLIRPRVESALEFEAMIRDRKDGFPSY